MSSSTSTAYRKPNALSIHGETVERQASSNGIYIENFKRPKDSTVEFPKHRSLNFGSLHEDKPDEFYELHYSKIYVEIYELVDKIFSGSRIRPQGFKTSLWNGQYPSRAISLVEMLAWPDDSNHHWDMLLRDRRERSFLIQAVIMKFLDLQVFSSLLFGASVQQDNVLRAEDSGLIQTEGFKRSHLRAQTNKAFLQATEGLPPRFWDKVAHATAQLQALLLPLRQVIGVHDHYPLELHQRLHDIVAYAGWLNICIRLSPAIINFQWVKPRERYELAQVNLSQAVYEDSKRKARESDELLKLRNPGHVTSERVARVKISVMPEVIRYTPGPSGGMIAYTVMKPHLVYYFGRTDDREEEQTYTSLQKYIQNMQRTARLRMHTFAGITIVAVFFLLYLTLTRTSTGTLVIGQWKSAIFHRFRRQLQTLW